MNIEADKAASAPAAASAILFGEESPVACKDIPCKLCYVKC